MLKNYLKVSIRNLRKHFSYSFINIFGLTVGLACTLVIGIWVFQEYSYDRHFDDADKIHRIGVNFFNVGNMSIGPEILKEKLKVYPETKYVTTLKTVGDVDVVYNNRQVTVESTFQIDEDYFKIFSYDFVHGDRLSAMEQPESIVITTEVANEIFGRTDVVNEVVQFKDNPKFYTITGVVKLEGNSHVPVKMWYSIPKAHNQYSWTSASSYIYAYVDSKKSGFRLKEMLDDQLEEIRIQFAPDQDIEAFKASGMYQFFPMKLTDIHLKSSLKFEPSPAGNEQTTRVFAGIAILILVLASINFINISTARSVTRAKEVGIRKSLGTRSNELIFQFTLESMIICLISVTLAIGVGELFLNLFERITGLELLKTLFQSVNQFIFIYVGAILLGIIAGIYPAIYLTRFKPVKVLKGQIDVKEKGGLRNGLVLFQFSISICLLIVSIFIYRQLSFIENKDMGFEMDNVMVLNNIRKVKEHSNFLKDELSKKSYVQSASLNDRMPASTMLSVTSLKDEEENEVWIQQFGGDENMLDCLGFRLIEGRNFSENIATDTSAIILNESAVAELGLTDPVGKTLNNGYHKVIGVISDFNYESLKKQVEPAMLSLATHDNYNLSIKFSGSSTQELINDIEKLWSGFGVEAEPGYYFLDENFTKLVEKEKVLSKAILLFTGLAMFISCLGLYGLSIFTAQQRTKEIGIRRVLGASIANITRLLSNNFAKPIIIAFIIATPIAYVVTNHWLADYAYRVDIGVLPFILGGSIALILGIITISWQSIKAALKNPVLSLRSE